VSPAFRPGVLPNDPAKPRLRLGPRLTGTPTPPTAVNWDRPVKAWPMLANDSVGDCVFAAIGHTIQTWTANASSEVVLTNAEVLAAYSAVTGYDPRDPSTDQGTVMQDAFSYWRKSGVAGHKILAFAEVDHRSLVELESAVALFGEVLLAIDFPDSAMDQFNEGQPWDVVYGAKSEGGHAICSARYDTGNKSAPWTVITWGREQPVTTRFLSKYLREAWVAVAPEWVAANGTTPSGLDLHGLGEDFAQLTGQPNPFVNPPEPPPRPVALVVAARNLAGDQGVLDWLARSHRRTADHHVAALVEAVVAAAQSEEAA
jgi:hypothetical protein